MSGCFGFLTHCGLLGAFSDLRFFPAFPPLYNVLSLPPVLAPGIVMVHFVMVTRGAYRQLAPLSLPCPPLTSTSSRPC